MPSVDLVEDITPRVQYVAAAGQTVFYFPFVIFTAADLVVDVDGVTQTLSADYDVEVEPDGTPTGTLTLDEALTGGEIVTIHRDIAIQRTSDFQTNGPLRAVTFNDELDRITMIMQQLEAQSGRSVRLAVTNPQAGSELELGASFEGKYLFVNSDRELEPAAAVGTTTLTKSLINGLVHPETSIEAGAGATVYDDSIPSHEVAGVVIPQRYFPSASPSTAEMLTVLTSAWTVALAAGVDIYAPAGTYDVGDANMPWRQTGTPTSLLDCGNITIRGDGPATVFKTSSTDGADVFQLNGLKNFHVRNLLITADLSATDDSGSNGISITAGFDNITILDVWLENLPSVDATSSVDGGKALTIQPSTTVNECGTLKARIFVKGCAGAFDYTPVLNTADDKKTCIDVEFIAEGCYRSVLIASGAATAAIAADYCEGVRVRGQAINCQRDVDIIRAHGVDVDVQVITTKTAAARRLDPNGVAWIASDTTVEALRCLMAHRSTIRVCGDKGECDYKARIGATTAGSSGLFAATEDSDIFLDLGGTATTEDVNGVSSGGNTLLNSRLLVSTATALTLPAAFYAASLNNRLSVGYAERGSFTATLTGCTTSPTGSIDYSVSGDIVTLRLAAITATSNSTAATLTGMPTAIKPAAIQTAHGPTTDNGATAWARITIATDGTITLGKNLISDTLTNSGTKGIQPGTVTYRRI